MTTMDINEKLKSFNENKLIDIVKNYRQYGYSDDIRNTAITILESRGIDLEILKLRGDLVNKKFDEAKQEFESFEGSSKIAFVLYVLMLVSSALVYVGSRNELSQIIFVILSWVFCIGFFIFLIKSFINQSRYYGLIGKKESQLNPILYLFVGSITYAVMYFIFRKQMRSEMNEIR